MACGWIRLTNLSNSMKSPFAKLFDQFKQLNEKSLYYGFFFLSFVSVFRVAKLCKHAYNGVDQCAAKNVDETVRRSDEQIYIISFRTCSASSPSPNIHPILDNFYGIINCIICVYWMRNIRSVVHPSTYNSHFHLR